MSPELSLRLYARHPTIFAGRERPELQTSLHEGIECGDGWFALIDTLCAFLQAETDRGAPPVLARQVKEKFGGLRFHAFGLSERQRAAIDFALMLSERTCEICGAPGDWHPADGERSARTRCKGHVGA